MQFSLRLQSNITVNVNAYKEYQEIFNFRGVFTGKQTFQSKDASTFTVTSNFINLMDLQ